MLRDHLVLLELKFCINIRPGIHSLISWILSLNRHSFPPLLSNIEYNNNNLLLLPFLLLLLGFRFPLPLPTPPNSPDLCCMTIEDNQTATQFKQSFPSFHSRPPPNQLQCDHSMIPTLSPVPEYSSYMVHQHPSFPYDFGQRPTPPFYYPTPPNNILVSP